MANCCKEHCCEEHLPEVTVGLGRPVRPGAMP